MKADLLYLGLKGMQAESASSELGDREFVPMLLLSMDLAAGGGGREGRQAC